MAAPRFAPVSPVENSPSYSSPDHVPEPWVADRPGELTGRQPAGLRLGHQGPDQGYALKLAARLRPELQLQPGEEPDDAVQGCTLIGLRRASLFGRAPVIHDLRIAMTMWGFLDPDPPGDLVTTRRPLFEGVGNTAHHYAEGRALADMVPEATLRMTPEQAGGAYPANWRTLTGAR